MVCVVIHWRISPDEAGLPILCSFEQIKHFLDFLKVQHLETCVV